MKELRDSFRQLIKLEELKDQLEETSPNAFENISLLSYPESWEAGPPKEKRSNFEGVEPFCLNFAEFDLKFQDKYDFFVKENTEPLREEELDKEGYRDLYGPVPKPEDFPHIKTLHCKRAQPFRLPRNFKQRLPFPVHPEPEEPTLNVQPWMMEPFPPKIDWSKQLYKGAGNGLKPMYVRWSEYPEYVERDADQQHQMDQPTITDMVMPYVTRKKKGLCRIPRETPDMTEEDVRTYMEETERKNEFTKLLLGDQPLHWWEDRKDQEYRDFQDFEIVGARGEDEARKLLEMGGDVHMREEEEERRNRRNARSWGGKRGWDNTKEEFDGEWKPPTMGRIGRIGSAQDGSWAGKGLGASGWNRQKMPMARKSVSESPPGDQPET